MELIDREELLRIIDMKIKYTHDDVAMDIPYNVRLNECLALKHIILNCKCINAETTRHGHWIESKEHIYIADGSCKEWINFYCSNCDAPTSEPRYYCPWCGAKMDMEEGEDETD